MVDLDAWHSDEARYKREALGLPDTLPEAEVPKLLPGMMFKARAGAELSPMNWQQFRNFFAKCHHTLAKVSTTLRRLQGCSGTVLQD